MVTARVFVGMVMLLPMVFSDEKPESLAERTKITPRRPAASQRGLHSGKAAPRLAFGMYSHAKVFPFGFGYGDTLMGKTDDGCEKFDLSVNIKYLGTYYNKIWVCNNGLITFDGPLWWFTPISMYSSSQTRKIIAPYWADIDTRGSLGGKVYYGEHTSGPILTTDGKDLVDGALQGIANFHPISVIVVTWEDCTFYGANAVGITKRNSFQLVIVSDGPRTFAFAMYLQLEWTTGTASGGHPTTGLDGTQALIGYSHGYSSGQYWHLPQFSFSNNAVLMTKVSNVGGPYTDWRGTMLMQCHLVGVLAPIMDCLRDHTCCVMQGNVYRPPIPGCGGFTQLNYLNLPTGTGDFIACGTTTLFNTLAVVCTCDHAAQVDPNTCQAVGIPWVS